VLTTGALLMGVGAVAAQPQQGVRHAVLITEMPVTPVAGPGRSPQAVIDRLLSFDANKDHRISRDELPERMHGLVARGDRNDDAALDSDEIRALMNAGSSAPTRVSFRSQSSGGLSDVIRDLKLPPAKHERALEIAAIHKVPRNFNDPLSADLIREMKALLDAEEYENFAVATVRLARNPLMRFGTVGGVIRDIPTPR
jgi:hypothetical protein